MGYTVNYFPELRPGRSRKRFRWRIPVITLVLILSGLLVRYTWPNETQQLRQTLFPWTRESVQEAFRGFREDLQDGEPIGSSITAFCLEILDEADSLE